MDGARSVPPGFGVGRKGDAERRPPSKRLQRLEFDLRAATVQRSGRRIVVLHGPECAQTRGKSASALPAGCEEASSAVVRCDAWNLPDGSGRANPGSSNRARPTRSGATFHLASPVRVGQRARRAPTTIWPQPPPHATNSTLVRAARSGASAGTRPMHNGAPRAHPMLARTRRCAEPSGLAGLARSMRPRMA